MQWSGEALVYSFAHALAPSASKGNIRFMPAIALKRFSLLAVVGVSVVLAGYDGWLSYKDLTPDEGLFSLYRVVLLVAFANWLIADTRIMGRSQPSFDYGWFIIAVLPIYGSYYLISTRRWRGLLMIAGAVLLFLAP